MHILIVYCVKQRCFGFTCVSSPLKLYYSYKWCMCMYSQQPSINCTSEYHLCLGNLFFLPLGFPSPPQAPSYTVQQYGQDIVTLTVQWQLPQYDGGGPVNYTITVSPGLSPVTISGTSVPVTVPYNVLHTVSIVATNCNGSSSATMEILPVIGMSSCYHSKLRLQRLLLIMHGAPILKVIHAGIDRSGL